MNLNEVARLLSWRREDVQDAITTGVKVPGTTEIVKLVASAVGDADEISDDDLNAFIARFEAAEPGRHPPTGVRRELLVESGHQCAVCRSDGPLQYHHIIEWSRLKHHDPQHMLPVCGTCHDKCGLGMIDAKAQRQYKAKVQQRRAAAAFAESDRGPIRFFWSDIADIIGAIHASVPSTLDANDSPSKFDLTAIDVEDKNTLNGLSDAYFEMMKAEQEPHFQKISDFLGAPENAKHLALYHDVVDDLRSQIAMHGSAYACFDEILRQLYEATVSASPELFKSQRRLLNVFFSFMYFTCDIGKKS